MLKRALAGALALLCAFCAPAFAEQPFARTGEVVFSGPNSLGCATPEAVKELHALISAAAPSRDTDGAALIRQMIEVNGLPCQMGGGFPAIIGNVVETFEDDTGVTRSVIWLGLPDKTRIYTWITLEQPTAI